MLLIHTVAALVQETVAVHHHRCIIGVYDDGSACQPLIVLVVGIKAMKDKVTEVGQP